MGSEVSGHGWLAPRQQCHGRRQWWTEVTHFMVGENKPPGKSTERDPSAGFSTAISLLHLSSISYHMFGYKHQRVNPVMSMAFPWQSPLQNFLHSVKVTTGTSINTVPELLQLKNVLACYKAQLASSCGRSVIIYTHLFCLLILTARGPVLYIRPGAEDIVTYCLHGCRMVASPDA